MNAFVFRLRQIAFPRGLRQGLVSAGVFLIFVIGVISFSGQRLLTHEHRGAIFPVLLYIAIAFTALYSLGFIVTATFPKYNIWFASFVYLAIWASTIGWAIWLVLIALL